MNGENKKKYFSLTELADQYRTIVEVSLFRKDQFIFEKFYSLPLFQSVKTTIFPS